MPERKIKPTIEKITCHHDPAEIFGSFKSRPYSFFLDSACDPGKLGRYSFMGCDPFLVFRSKGDRIELSYRSGRRKILRGNPFLILKKLLRKYEVVKPAKALPFTGGAIGYFSYDMKEFIEDLPDKSKDDLGIWDSVLGFYDTVIIYDNLKHIYYISTIDVGERGLPDLKEIVSSGLTGQHGENPAYGQRPRSGLRSNFSKNAYASAVKKSKAYIKKGDIYQVNISQRFQATLPEDPFDLYLRLRRCSPAPFASYLNFGDIVILSSSPERYLLKRGDYVETRPIKGTRPRGRNAVSDRALKIELENSDKDMAEHIMIVDLERNDLGRICEYGSIRPMESAITEKYANVFHLVSTVSGRLKPKAGPIDCLVATFPGGSITGAPKIRSMEIIDELEKVKRSVYTGAIGYIGFDGNMDTSIVIRTFIIKDGIAYFQVGGGIVADSDPEKEYEETLHKAAGLMQALNIGTVPKGRLR